MSNCEDAVAPPYVSRFENWNERASVRVKPRRLFAEEEEKGRVFFPKKLVPVLDHPLVAGLGAAAERELLIRELYTYLDFTTFLEHDLVNSAARRIATGGTDFELPSEMLFDAYKLYCDEAYHALFSEDLKRQIQSATGIVQNTPDVPMFLTWVREQQRKSDKSLHAFLEVFFAMIVETLISSTLVLVPRDTEVVSSVRRLVADHAEDEAFHFQYFAHLFRLVWPRLERHQREVVGPLLPHFIMRFLGPDTGSIARNLGAVGLSDEEVHKVIEESFPHHRVVAKVRRMARVPLRLFEEFEIRSDTKTAEAFEQVGLNP